MEDGAYLCKIFSILLVFSSMIFIFIIVDIKTIALS